MKRKFILIFSICCVFGCANAQRFISGAINNAANAAARGVGNAVAKKAESIAEKQMEVYLSKKLSAYEQHLAEESKKYQAAMGAWQDSLIAMTNVPFEDEYEFNTLVNSEIVMTSEDGEKENLACTYYLNSTAEYYGYGMGEMLTVMDYKNQVMVCFSTNDTSKVYFAYKYTPVETTASDEGLEKLAENKSICGYNCSGYKFIGPLYNGKCWASTSADFNGKYTNMYVPKNNYGFPLYMVGTIYGENGQKVDYVSEAKSVKKNVGFKVRKTDFKNMFE
jgi:hypothetical protein